ncbi:hypothetical protein [Halobacillus sp. Marseille-Q1614]|uniref:hypothetical protein n=1 Tax=Halobacillus sp. Marseille-Q1614 TaxID=2709134 RepID=UPI00157074A7|nr:hypothetical protein [Halobacillus sp. Marseille-Q1614]
MKKTYIKKTIQWLVIALSIVMILIGLVVAYLFVADIYYDEDKDQINENVQPVSIIKEEIN